MSLIVRAIVAIFSQHLSFGLIIFGATYLYANFDTFVAFFTTKPWSLMQAGSPYSFLSFLVCYGALFFYDQKRILPQMKLKIRRHKELILQKSIDPSSTALSKQPTSKAVEVENGASVTADVNLSQCDVLFNSIEVVDYLEHYGFSHNKSGSISSSSNNENFAAIFDIILVYKDITWHTKKSYDDYYILYTLLTFECDSVNGIKVKNSLKVPFLSSTKKIMRRIKEFCENDANSGRSLPGFRTYPTENNRNSSDHTCSSTEMNGFERSLSSSPFIGKNTVQNLLLTYQQVEIMTWLHRIKLEVVWYHNNIVRNFFGIPDLPMGVLSYSDVINASEQQAHRDESRYYSGDDSDADNNDKENGNLNGLNSEYEITSYNTPASKAIKWVRNKAVNVQSSVRRVTKKIQTSTPDTHNCASQSGARSLSISPKYDETFEKGSFSREKSNSFSKESRSLPESIAEATVDSNILEESTFDINLRRIGAVKRHDGSYSSNDVYNISWSGTSSEDFQFLDLSAAAKGLCLDISACHGFKVRGPDYDIDKKKVECGPSISKLLLMELYEVEVHQVNLKSEKKDSLNSSGTVGTASDRYDHIASMGKVKRRLEILQILTDEPFIFILNIAIPGNPPVCIVSYFAIPRRYLTQQSSNSEESIFTLSSAERTDRKFKDMFCQFINVPTTDRDRMLAWGINPDDPNASDPATVKTVDVTFASSKEPGGLPLAAFQNKRFKLIPKVTEGPWVVRMAVSPTPVLLGQKVAQRYFRGDNYFEVDVHVGSSMIASQIVGLCRGYAKSFVSYIGVVMQGEDGNELPEQMLACIALNKIDIDIRSKLF